MESKKIRPVAEIVRDPISRIPLAKEGEVKTMTTYWRRRLLDGDVEEVKTSKPVSENSSKKKTEEKK